MVHTAGADELQHIARGIRNVRARSEDRRDTRLAQEVVILRRDHATDDNQNVTCLLLLQRLDQHRHQRLVSRRLAGDADDMHVRFHSVLRNLFRSLE